MTMTTESYRGKALADRVGRFRWPVAVALCLLLLPAPCLAARPDANGPVASPEPDWPQWRGTQRDGISGEKNLLPTWPAGGPKLVWKLTDMGRGWSSPIVVRDRIYITGDVGEKLVIFAFDLDGKEIWKVANGRSWKGSYPGARACLAYSEGKLYHMNAHGRVVCLDPATGEEIWAVNVLARFQGRNIRWAMSECLLVDGDRVIVTPTGRKALMAALDKKTGKTLWTTPPLGDDQASHCSPLLFRHAGRRILASCTAAHGFAVDADTGKLLWTVPLKGRYGVNIATPVYGAGKGFYVAPHVYGACYDLEPTEAGPKARKAWDTIMDTCTGTTLLVDSVLYGSGYKKHKSWLCLDWETGQKRHELKDLAPGAAVYADGRLYCLAQDGRAGLIRLTKDGLKIDSRFRLVPKVVRDAWAHPVLLNGRLYLRYHDTFWCFDVRGK